MKWPETITLIRHDISAYNEFKKNKVNNPLYKQFLQAYSKDWQSPETKVLAERTWKELALNMGDHETPLAKDAGLQAEKMAEKLAKAIELPDIIFISPYKRTKDTFEFMKKGWPKLGSVEQKEEERMREREHGKLLLYNDRKIFHVFNPEEKMLEEMEGNYWYRFPGGESIPDVRARVSRFNDMLIREFAEKNVLVITHHETILSYRANIGRWEARQYLEQDKKDKPINCGVTIYRGHPELGKNGRLVLDIYNAKLY